MGTTTRELIGYVKILRSRCRLGILGNSFVGARNWRWRCTSSTNWSNKSSTPEIGVCKPDPHAFAITCARPDVTASDCLFVDDNEVTVEAARVAGMRAHLFDGNARTIARIEAHLSNPMPPYGS